MRKTLQFLSCLTLICSSVVSLSVAAPAPAAKSSEVEDWKGPSKESRVQVGGMGGLGIIDTTPAIQITGFAAFRVVKRGFVEDINDAVWAELQVGPAITANGTGLAFMPGLRWDFHKDEAWSLYALGGVGGNYFTFGGPANRVAIFPRFAVGGFFHINWMTYLRAEISHEFIGLGGGVSF